MPHQDSKGGKIMLYTTKNLNQQLEIQKLKEEKDNLIRALKRIRDNEGNDLAEYALFCENTAKEALREVEV